MKPEIISENEVKQEIDKNKLDWNDEVIQFFC